MGTHIDKSLMAMPDDGDGSTHDLSSPGPSASFVWGSFTMSMALLLAGVWLQG